MAIGGSIIAFWAYQEGQKRIEASEAAIFTYLQPAFSIPLSLIWLKEPFTPVTILATVIIISGVYLSEKR
jgi:drug/metabolite transporter (DMT)-like permease